jgi:hypothetical protein
LSAPEREVTSPSDFKVVGALMQKIKGYAESIMSTSEF